ncbi:agmatine/peptidylarginine deiminase [uncultured Robinsoniella sp.]|uniref:agmatine deiminase family protein n=1 Tax=uncultured Robinsoniella sp. TaxID=904190 RepID=UPI00374F65F7
MRKKIIVLLLMIAVSSLTACDAQAIVKLQEEGDAKMPTQYYFPAEESTHEGTWLTWPHHYTYGTEYRNEIEGIWLEMVEALHIDEKVHIVAYDEAEQHRITKLLEGENIDINRVDFVIAKTDDVWSRDTGPMFVLDERGKTYVADFAFDGWGGKMPYQNDNKIPQAVAAARGYPILTISDFVLEGGSVELDGNGTAMLNKSSVVSMARNPGLNVQQAEEYLKRYLGATNFIWLEGVVGEDVTDAHIDGTARFFNDTTILTMKEEDFFNLYEGVVESDYDKLLSAKNARGEPYEIIELPMTSKNVEGLDYKGSYLNYYVGNKVVLLPVYGDSNDDIAAEILSELYTGRDIVPVNVTALYQYGGMLHCITQQQPAK